MGGGLSTQLLRPGLLEGVSLLLAAAPERTVATAAEEVEGVPLLAGVPVVDVAATVAERCARLSARVASCAPISEHGAVADEGELDEAVAAVAREAGGVDLLAVDGAGLLAHGLGSDGDGHRALRACMDGAWNATRAVVNRAFLAVEPSHGRVVYLAPAPDAGSHADAARAGLENLARTLSTEWARHGITTVTIAPGRQTSPDELATLVAYLASPGGAYFSGCLLDLRGV